ncbi:FHA domain-containing protein [Paenibacillus gorillae]|uniref:FHA domain-containing protein n=1 Tax=Paenibacillus gorillae TaxID=1243662 RepID=UPI0004B3A1E7|nr:FHA domain-containing protein [Paenibacillus gorillae]
MIAQATTAEGHNRGGKGGRSKGIIIIDILILITVIEALYYAFFINTDEQVMWAAAIAALTALLIFLGVKLSKRNGMKRKTEPIAKLVLLDEEGERMKEWYINGETSLLIGKSSGRSEVDIDLSDAEYASIISPQHAVLNYAQGAWYVEDLDSRNGVGLRKFNRSAVTRLDNEQPYRLDAGDLLLIANTRLLVK